MTKSEKYFAASERLIGLADEALQRQQSLATAADVCREVARETPAAKTAANKKLDQIGRELSKLQDRLVQLYNAREMCLALGRIERAMGN
jgi:phosphoribosylanthranilate isomerase